MIPLLKLGKVNWSRVAGIGAVAGIVALGLYARIQHLALKQTQVVYRNPRTVRQARVVRVEGPKRILTRTVKTADREEVTREEVHAPVTEIRESFHLQEPILPPAPRTDRWLLGAAAQPLHYRDHRTWTAYAGYSFRNRLDLCAGIAGTGRASLLIMIRF